MGTLQGAWVPPSLQFVLLDTGGCIHVMISADKAVLARLVNVRLQKRQHDIALLLKICVPVEDRADRYVHVAPDAVARHPRCLMMSWQGMNQQYCFT